MPETSLELFFGLASVLSVLIALWASSRLMRAVAPLVATQSVRAILGRRLSRYVTWLALSALLTMPLLDGLGIIRSLPEIVSPSAWHSQAQLAATPWGSAPWPLYSLLVDLMVIVAYASAFGPVLRIVRASSSQTQGLSLPGWAAAYLTAVVGALLYRLLKAAVLGVVWLRIPLPVADLGLGGFAAGWILGLLFLLIAVVLFRNPLEEDNDQLAAA